MNARNLKPSVIVLAAYQGLLDAEKREDFRVNMDLTPVKLDNILLGDLGTCTVQRITGKQFTGLEISSPVDSAEYMDWTGGSKDFQFFTEGVNALLDGNAMHLIDYCSGKREINIKRRKMDIDPSPKYHSNPQDFKQWLLATIEMLQGLELGMI